MKPKENESDTMFVMELNGKDALRIQSSNNGCYALVVPGTLPAGPGMGKPVELPKLILAGLTKEHLRGLILVASDLIENS